MKKTPDVGVVVSRAREAANEEFIEARTFETLVRAPASGWDPYEVWRTRVKDEAELHERDSRTA